jgi:hypothetical protein
MIYRVEQMFFSNISFARFKLSFPWKPKQLSILWSSFKGYSIENCFANSTGANLHPAFSKYFL